MARSDALQVRAVPMGSRADIEDHVPISGPWVLVSTVAGVRTWEAPSPVRPRTLFFHRPPDDMKLVRRSDADQPWSKARRVKHDQGLESADEAGSWDFSTRAVRVRRARADGPPQAHEYAVSYTKAITREKELQRRFWTGTDRDFVQRSLQVDDTTQAGLFLPAPAEVAQPLQIQAGAVLDLTALLIPPEAADPASRSDGASVQGWLELAGGERAELFDIELQAARQTVPVRVSLEQWAGQEASLVLSTTAGDTTELDYVFLTEPVIYVPSEDPPRVALIFIDTLRPDHMSLYGYERPTTPKLDAWAEQAAVFDQARSVAPWTLPSSRTMLLGTQPERWSVAPPVQATLGDAGWATGFFAGNVYLSSNFEMAEAWGTHRCINWPQGSVQVDRALSWLDAHSDRPAFVLLHLMDMHLPYTEPASYRRLFAGDTPEILKSDSFLRGELTRRQADLGEEGKQYVRDRYDNNLRYLDDQLERFLAQLDEDDLVLIVSDHGEEFWDHGGFEHGHTLYDELLRVPLIVRGPGLTPGRFSTPASLLDLTPTIIRATGVDHPATEGLALQDLSTGSVEGADQRPLSFGRPLYGDRRWGTLLGDRKYQTSQGSEQIYDLSADPQENSDQVTQGLEPGPWREITGAGLSRTTRLGFRLVSTRTKTAISARLQVPGGVAWAYSAEDPIKKGSADVQVVGDVVEVSWPRKNSSTHEVFVVPNEPAETVLPQLILTVDGEPATAHFDTEGEVAQSTNDPLWSAAKKRAGVNLTWGVVPEPLQEGTAVGAFNAEVAAELAALGYMDEDEGEGAGEEVEGPPDEPGNDAGP